MIAKLTLSHFRKHIDLTINFSEGLLAIRAANEAGKSSLIESIAYVMFGSRVLRDSLEDVVTWGHPVRDLKVVLEYGDYTIARSKGGAEVTSLGQVLVTGQTEVTRFCETLVGCDAATAMNLMFANQTDLRGVLNAGPKATSAFLEQLSDLDLFDRLIDAAQSKLSLGSAALQEERLRNLIAEREALPEVSAPDKGVFETSQAILADETARLQNLLSTDLLTKYERENDQYQAELTARSVLSQLDSKLRWIEDRLDDAKAGIAEVGIVGQPRDTTTLEAEIAAAQQWQTRREAYAKFKALPKVQWPVDRKGWSDQYDELERRGSDLRAWLNKCNQAAAVAKAQLVTSSVCGFCGQDVSQFPEAAAKNEALAREIELQMQAALDAEAQIKENDALVRDFNKAREEDQAQAKLLRNLSGFVDVDESMIPAAVTWNGEVPAEAGPDVTQLQAQLRSVRNQNDAIMRACAKVDTLTEQKVKLEAEKGALLVERGQVQMINENLFQDLVLSLSRVRGEIDAVRAEMDEIAQRIKAAQAVFDEQVRVFETAQRERGRVEARIVETEREIETLQFNNQLVKKIRAARPVVGNKLWAIVLASVSSIFTQMRGEDSIVTKGSDGFLVNGKAVTSYSGSTLDLLGLALRIALVKTFIPACPFIVLDEPGASMDGERESSMMGYIAASGFQQVILVTHSDRSESVATTLIEL